MNIFVPVCAPELPDVLSGRRFYYNSKHGKIYFNTYGKGAPVLLVHSINAGASNFEWRCNFAVLAQQYKVYALDLPGFGRSEKKKIAYTADIYISVLLDFIKNVAKQPIHIIAGGLAAAYCCNLANQYPEIIRTLSLITPAGIGTNASPPCESGLVTFRLFTSPVQGDALYNAFVAKPSIRYFLSTFIYANPDSVNSNLIDYLYQSTHQCPYAQYAPSSFIAGLSNLDITKIFSELTQPILLIWGQEAKIGSLRYKDEFLRLNPAASYHILPQSALSPQTEKWRQFNKIVTTFINNNK